MHFNGFDEKLITTENKIARKLFNKIETQRLFPDEERELYLGIMEIYDVLHRMPNTEKPTKKINEIITRRKIYSALENEVIYNTFWNLLLTHDETGKVVPHEMVLLDLKDKFEEDELIKLLEEKQEEVFPQEGEFETYMFQYETEYWSLKIKFKALLRKREISAVLKNLFQRDADNIETFLKSNNIIYKDFECIREKVNKSENIKLSKYDYVVKNFDTLVDCDNYYLYLSTSQKTSNGFLRVYRNIMRIKRDRKLNYISITQNYLETYDDGYSDRVCFYKDWEEISLSECGDSKKITGPRALYLLQNIEEFECFNDFKEKESCYY